ncbi:MFS transporter [Streptomyces sp. NPDC051569]|uniref:MFS transporter n=1 Tax=Streptomyces sp. NPDC051569 TaxID=3365661 RepID=UPI0037A99BF9
MSSPKLALNKSYIFLLLAFILIEATGAFEQVMIYAAIPFLMGHFHMDASALSWTVTLFLLVGAGTAAISSRLADLYGRKRVLLVLMALSALGSFISFAFANYEAILVGRALQGTSAALFPILIALAREILPPPRVPVAASIVTGTAIIAGALGTFVGGVIIDGGTWRYMFLTSALLAVASIAVAVGVLPKSVVPPRDGTRIDWLGGVLLAPAVASILYGFTRTKNDGWGDGLVMAFIAAGLVLAVFWVVYELRVESPMFNLRLFRRRALVLCLLATALVAAGSMAAGSLLIPILMQSPELLPVGLGLSATAAGAYGLIGAGASFGLSPSAGRLAAKYGARVTLAVGVVVSIVGFAMLLVVFGNLPLVIVASTVSAIGGGFVLAGLPNVIIEAVPARNTGEAIGLVYSVSRTIFVAVGTSVVSLLLASSVVPKTTAPTEEAWRLSIGFVVVTLAAALVVTLLMRGSKSLDEPAEAPAPGSDQVGATS